MIECDMPGCYGYTSLPAKYVEIVVFQPVEGFYIGNPLSNCQSHWAWLPSCRSLVYSTGCMVCFFPQVTQIWALTHDMEKKVFELITNQHPFSPSIDVVERRSAQHPSFDPKGCRCSHCYTHLWLQWYEDQKGQACTGSWLMIKNKIAWVILVRYGQTKYISCKIL